MIIQLENGGTLDVPMMSSEIKFADYSDFRARDIERLNKGAEIEMDEFYAAMIDCVQELVPGIDSSLPFGDTITINMGLLNIGEELTLCRLYGHLMAVVNQDEAPVLPFEWKGQIWTLSEEVKDYVLGGGAFAVGEVITVMELSRNFRKAREEAQKENKDYLALANIDFELDLRTFAVIVRQPGEKLPINKLERENLIHERMHVFEDLPMNIVNSVNFFLRGSLIDLTLSPTIRNLRHMISSGKGASRNDTKAKSRKTTQGESQKVRRKGVSLAGI